MRENTVRVTENDVGGRRRRDLDGERWVMVVRAATTRKEEKKRKKEKK